MAQGRASFEVLKELWFKAAAWRYIAIGAGAATLFAAVFPPTFSPGGSSYVRPPSSSNAPSGPMAPRIPTGQGGPVQGSASVANGAMAGAAAGIPLNPGTPAVPKIRPGGPIEGVEDPTPFPGLKADMVGEVEAAMPVGGKVADSEPVKPAVPKISPGGPIEGVEDPLPSPGLSADMVGEVKAAIPIGGKVAPSEPLKPTVPRIRPGTRIEDSDG